MILSKYNVYVKDFPVIGVTTIYNLVTKGLVCIESNTEIEKITEYESDAIAEMEKFKMIFISEDEQKKYIQSVMEKKYDTDERLDITLVTTHNCNLQCTYCFEGKSKNENLTMDVCKKIISDIDDQMCNKKYKSIAIRYYGGEPMVNIKCIDYVNQYMLEKYNNKFSFSLVTNGVLLNEQIINRWKKYNWTGIKVTLDGDKIFNDSRRIAKDGISTYDRVVKNIMLLPDTIEIFLHIVVDDSNIEHLDGMFRDLSKRNMQSKLVIGISYTHPHINVDPQIRAMTILKAASKARDYGFYLSNLISVDGEGICPNKNHNSYLVDIDGSKYKCTGFMAMKDCPEGFYKGTNEKFYNNDRECLCCKYLPVCNGGCQYLKMYNGGKKYCQKDFFDKLIPELLKFYIDYSVV